MEDADILTKKRDNSHGCSSYLLSSESLGDHQFGLSTPNFGEALTSSYFNSPSSSEKVVHPGTRLDSLQDLTELTLDLDDSDRELSKQKCSQRSPFHPEDRIAGLRCGKQHLDILSDLLALGCTSICEKICSYMKAQDLYRFVLCKLLDFIVVLCSLQIWLCQLQMEKENCGTPHFQNSSSYDEVTTFPLREINLKLSQRQSQDQQNKASKTPKSQICSCHSITPQTNNELRPCPKCTSPSTVSKSHNGHFQCQKCGLRFCPTCLRYTEQHVKSKKCYGLSTAQFERLGPRKCEKNIVGHKKTKYRLRRL
ncbi:hypothetical protein P5673_017574 [Acropora cervicornis]|uniref:Uncharacterized protein n=1 Tax=Acropora cervicornis TaxID=6130 RepID=A0AAD9QFL4_ACRCE|nr:hypothetical protein P5673_017574 [Acropora cervicornis]